MTSAVRRIFTHLNNLLSSELADKLALTKMNLTSMEVSVF